jgi:K+ transporter
MRKALFALAALVATAAMIALALLIANLVGRLHGGWVWIFLGIVVLAAIVRLALRRRAEPPG